MEVYYLPKQLGDRELWEFEIIFTIIFELGMACTLTSNIQKILAGSVFIDADHSHQPIWLAPRD
jgi:hypothetical protein